MKAFSVVSKVAAAARKFASDKRGNISMMAGLAAVPMVIAGGAAIDYDRAINAKTELQASLDSAVLYASTQNSNDMETLTNASQPYLTVNYNNNADAKVKSYAISAGSGVNTLKATGVVTMNTWFMSTVGITTLDVTASSEALHVGSGRNINLEVSLVLDNTGSMNTPGPGFSTAPIGDLKTAASNFVDTVMGSSQTPYYTKIAVIPYNNSVNMGSSAMALAARGGYTSGTSTTPGYANFTFPGCNNSSCSSTSSYTMPITNCVTERTGAQAYTDASTATYPVGRAYFDSANDCTVQPMVPLSTNATTLKNTINAMSAGNSTAGQVGIAWGWYALSPNIGVWSGASVPAGYDKLTTTDTASKVKKIMILMTDAEYNSAFYHGVITGKPTVSGSGGYIDHINQPPENGDSYTQSTNMCNAIKQSGIEIYVVAFQLDSSYPARVNLINNCATDASHVLTASNQAQLNSVFQSLAQNLVSLRLTN